MCLNARLLLFLIQIFGRHLALLSSRNILDLSVFSWVSWYLGVVLIYWGILVSSRTPFILLEKQCILPKDLDSRHSQYSFPNSKAFLHGIPLVHGMQWKEDLGQVPHMCRPIGHDLTRTVSHSMTSSFQSPFSKLLLGLGILTQELLNLITPQSTWEALKYQVPESFYFRKYDLRQSINIQQ